MVKVLYGKAWKKGQAEPTDWSIELTDDTPNLSGPSGIYGAAMGIQPPNPGTPIFYDNITLK